MSKKDGGPAFPLIEKDISETGYAIEIVTRGMSLRDWFAGQAVAAIAQVSMKVWSVDGDSKNAAITEASFLAYQIADAMIKARQL